MITGFITRRIGFFRTPKKAQANAFLKALGDAREELLFAAALVLAVGGILFSRPDAGLLDTRVWPQMLAVQALPYASAVVVSLISGLPRLPARLIGVMAPLKGMGGGGND